jgi:hypothetical protein
MLGYLKLLKASVLKCYARSKVLNRQRRLKQIEAKVDLFSLI